MSDQSMERRLSAGTAFADLSFWRKVEVSGADAAAWLQDLVSADIEDLAPGRARRSLLLSPTGRIRAQFTVAPTGSGWLLLQDPEQPQPVGALLARYVLSSDVVLKDRTDDLALFAVPGRIDLLEIAEAQPLTPSCLGGGMGHDLVASIHDHGHLGAFLETQLLRVGNEAIEEWRVVAGIPRFGVDATDEDLPEEAGLDEAVAFDKGCYLGQEAVAKVRNLGHPRRLVLHFRGEGTVSPGDRVLAGEDEAGQVTSAVVAEGVTVLLARIAWGARGESLRTASGVPLAPAQASSPV